MKKETKEVLNFSKIYETYFDFAEDTREEIYMSIYRLMDSLKNPKINESKLYISAKVDGINWDTDFTIKKGDSILITRDLIPFFEKREDYEMCKKLKELHRDLTT
jgi:hypothetical protein